MAGRLTGKVALFLAVDESSVTGANYPVDGDLTAV